MKLKVSILSFDKFIFLNLIELGVSPGQILAFVTGTWQIPPMGFPNRPNITFISDESKTLPTSSTCDLTLRLPLVLIDYDHFKTQVTKGFLNTVGFGQA